MDPFIERVASLITGAMTQLGSAGLMGFCTGVALKRATTEVAYTLGGAFVFLQVHLRSLNLMHLWTALPCPGAGLLSVLRPQSSLRMPPHRYSRGVATSM